MSHSHLREVLMVVENFDVSDCQILKYIRERERADQENIQGFYHFVHIYSETRSINSVTVIGLSLLAIIAKCILVTKEWLLLSHLL